MTTSYFAAAQVMSRFAGQDLLAPRHLAERKRALLDFLDHGLARSGRQFPMRSRFTFILIGIVFLIALVVYIFTTPRGGDIPLTGIVDGNEVIVSPQITGRMIRLTVDEGSQVKKGDLIAELDPKELEASLAAAKANVDMLAASVGEAQHNVAWTNDQTNAALNQAGAMVTSTGAQVEQAKANLWRDQMDFDRAKMLADKGELSAQDRDHAEANVRISEANLKAL